MRILLLFLMMPILLVLQACEPAAYWDGVPADRKLETSERTEEVTLAFDSVTRQISPQDRLQLVDAIRRGQGFGTVSLDLLSLPVSDPAFLAGASRLVAQQGIPTDRVRLGDAADLPVSLVLVRIHAIRVRTPVCAGVPTASTTDTTRLDKRQYVLGCATAANLAAMLADPRDLSAEPEMGPMDAERTIRPIDTLRTKSEGKTSRTGGGSSLNISTGGDGAARAQ